MDVPRWVDLVDWRNNQCVCKLQQKEDDKFYSLALDRERRMLLTGHRNGKVALRDFPSGRELDRFQVFPDFPCRVELSPDRQVLAVFCGKTIKLLKAAEFLDAPEGQ